MNSLDTDFVAKLNSEIRAESFSSDIEKFDIIKSDEFEPLIEVWRSEKDPNYLVYLDEEGHWFELLNEDELIKYCIKLLYYEHNCDFEDEMLTISQLKKCIESVYTNYNDSPEWDNTTNDWA